MGRHPPQILPLREDFSEGLVLLELYANKKLSLTGRKIWKCPNPHLFEEPP